MIHLNMPIMKKLFIILIVIFSVLFVGCVSKTDSVSAVTTSPTSKSTPSIKEQTTSTPTKPIPEDTIKTYVFCYNKLVAKCIYDLFSNETQLSEDEIHNTIYAYLSQGVKINNYEIVDKSIIENKAILDVKIRWDVAGSWVTNDYKIPLILENNKWKMSGKLILP